MKTQLFTKYGLPENVLQLKEIEKPIPKKNELLIKIKATTINDFDWALVTGKPKIYQLIFGLFKPKHHIPGMELSGVVEQIGADVQNFKAGDQVYGDISNYGFGTFAEYLCINENAVIKKPVELSFEEAASIPHASLLAYQALVDLGEIKQGMKVLINGGGGGVGAVGLQIAKLYQCEVSGVDSNEKLAMMQSFGYDHVIDYKKVDFTKNGNQYDLILDCKTSKSAFSYFRSLKANGIYVSIGGQLSKILSITIWGKLFSAFSTKKLKMLPLKPNKELEKISQLIIQNDFKYAIDGPYSIHEIPRLLQYFGEGKHQGKIVVKM
jgi:NADPH:quinone reductase-like Zn-dependent oxidoreductase